MSPSLRQGYVSSPCHFAAIYLDLVAGGNADCKVGQKPAKQKAGETECDRSNRGPRTASQSPSNRSGQMDRRDGIGLEDILRAFVVNVWSNGLCVLLQKVTEAMLRGSRELSCHICEK